MSQNTGKELKLKQTVGVDRVVVFILNN